MDLQSVEASAEVARAFQQDRLEDILLFKHVLWHAWHSITAKLAICRSTPGEGTVRKQQKKARRRATLAARNYQAKREEDFRQSQSKKSDESVSVSKGSVECPHVQCDGYIKRFTLAAFYQHLYVLSFMLQMCAG